MRKEDLVFRNSAPEEIHGNSLLLRKAVVEPVDKDVRVNQRGHVGTGPLASTRGPLLSLSGAPPPSPVA